MDQDTIKHLEFIQDVITRMNSNSFQIKNWSITITSALLALYASSEKTAFIFVAIMPTLVFWLLDTYYLQQERKFRGIYNDITCLSAEDNRIVVRNFEMPIQKYNGGKYSYHGVMWSRTIWPLYLLQIIGLFFGGSILAKWWC